MLFRQIFFCRILSVSCTTDNVCFGRPNLHFKEVHYYEHRQIKNTQNGHARHDGCHRRCHLTYSENRGYVPYCTPDKHRLFRTSGTVVFIALCHSHRNHPNDVYGYPATCTDRCRIRRIFIRRFLPRFSWKDYLRSDRRNLRNRYHRLSGFLPCNGISYGQKRTERIFLHTNVSGSNLHGRHHCLFLPESIKSRRNACQISAKPWSKSI